MLPERPNTISNCRRVVRRAACKIEREKSLVPDAECSRPCMCHPATARDPARSLATCADCFVYCASAFGLQLYKGSCPRTAGTLPGNLCRRRFAGVVAADAPGRLLHPTNGSGGGSLQRTGAASRARGWRPYDWPFRG